MVTKISVTHQIDDPREAVADLLSGLGDLSALGKNSVGLLQCYSDMELEPFVQSLRAALPFDVIGCTCIASMDNVEGFHVISASLVVLSADDCTFGVGVSGAITPDTVEENVRTAYQKAAEGLPETPKLLYVLPPYDLAIMLDAFTDALNRVAPDVPVLGGLPSFNATGDANATIFGADVYPDRLVMLAISGNIRPVFSVQNVSGSAVERKRRVTRATNNTVYTVGDERFTDYMAEIGFPLSSLTGSNDTITFVSNPLLLENVSLPGGENFSFVRTLHKIDLAEGSGTAIGMIPENATLSISSLQKDDIAKAAGIGMRDLAAKMQGASADGYTFTTVLAVSCIGRHLLMLPEANTETDNLLAELPEGLAFSGFYGYGEIGPLAKNDNAMLNFAHNESLVLCAF